MHLMSLILCTLVNAAVLAPQQGQAAPGQVSIEEYAWPTAKACESCIPLQFGLLTMRVPLAKIGRLLIFGSDLSGVNLFPPDNDPLKSVLLDSIPRERLVGLYENSRLLQAESGMNNEAFFDRLGKPSSSTDPFSTIRKIQGIDRARRYLKASRGGIHAYAVQSAPPISDTVYLVVNGEDTVYALHGRVTPEILEYMLSNMHVVSTP